MNFDEFKKCVCCRNIDSLKSKCQACNYSGYTYEGKPSTNVLGATPKLAKELKNKKKGYK